MMANSSLQQVHRSALPMDFGSRWALEGAGLAISHKHTVNRSSFYQDGLLDLIIPYQTPNKGRLRAL